jgi:hypothetical protein
MTRGSGRDLELVDASGTNGNAGALGDLCTLLAWHEAFPPTERVRAALVEDGPQDASALVRRVLAGVSVS